MRNQLASLARLLAVAAVAIPHLAVGAEDADDAPRFEFTRMIAHWTDYGTPEYLRFIEDAGPEVVQVGEYGGHFYSLIHTEHGGGYPHHFPVRGLDEGRDFFRQLNAQVRARDAKVIGHMNVTFMTGDLDHADGPRGFFHWYDQLWDEATLGPRPPVEAVDLLQKTADGQPLAQENYGIGGMKEYWACLNNPHWRAVLKAWVKAGIDLGVDGYMINYFYRKACMCEHCDAGFRADLAERFTPAELRERFGIDDPATHDFGVIVDWHPPAESTPLKREMLRWSQVSIKQAFDEVFIDYGRSLKPDLIVGQWNHLGDFNQNSGDERCMLPAELWGRGEDYLWYSTGDTANHTDLEKGFLGDATLRARFIRGMFDDKPFTVGKYEATRTRVSIAELAANGGAPMGFYTRFTDPEARAEIVRYFNFIERHRDVFHANRPHGEVLLVFPRRAVFEGDVAAVERFKQTGRELLEAHVLFDVLSDDQEGLEAASRRYLQVLDAAGNLVRPEGWAAALQMSQFAAPQTVRVSASRSAQGEALDLHFVNYNRLEPEEPRSPGGGIHEERPIPASGVQASVLLPEGTRATAVRVMTPESPEPVELKDFDASEERVGFDLPEFLVYAVVRIHLESEEVEPQVDAEGRQ